MSSQITFEHQVYNDDLVQTYTEQERAIEKALPTLREGKSIYLQGGTGSGKTFVLGKLLRLLIDERQWQTVLIVTPASVKYQMIHDLCNKFKFKDDKRIFIVSYNDLKAQMGEMWTCKEWKEYKIYEQDKNPITGEYTPKLDANGNFIIKATKRELVSIEWNDWLIRPDLIVLDEVQNIKNHGSMQTKMMLQAKKQFPDAQFICMSATPGQCIDELRNLTLLLSPPCDPKLKFMLSDPYTYMAETPEDKRDVINKDTWRPFAALLCMRSAPTDFNMAAIKRWTEALDDQFVRIETARMKYKCKIEHVCLQFENDEERQKVMDIFNDLLQALEELDPNDAKYHVNVLVAMLRYRQASELVRVPRMLQRAQHLMQQGYAPIIGVNFKETINAIFEQADKYGIDQARMSLIDGSLSQKQKAEHKAAFQFGKSDVMVLNVKAGGVGLSIHHNPQNIDKTKPRAVILPPVWSGIDMVQVLGRAYRRDNVSDVYQEILWYAGTIEERVCDLMGDKIKAMGGVASSREPWRAAFVDLVAEDTGIRIDNEAIDRQQIAEDRQGDDGEGVSMAFDLVGENIE